MGWSGIVFSVFSAARSSLFRDGARGEMMNGADRCWINLHGGKAVRSLSLLYGRIEWGLRKKFAA
jgi:hypothetical protein